MAERDAVNADVAGSSHASPATLVSAFEVWNPKTGHRWMIYPDGQVRGFGECVAIVNRIPRMIAEALHDRDA